MMNPSRLIKKSLPLILASLAMPACMLDQQAPKATAKPVSSGALGIVVMEDTLGARRSARFTALFGKKAEAAKSIVARAFENRAEQCTIAHGPIAQGRASDEITLVTAGKLGLGPALQSALMAIPEDAKHQYATKLEPDFAAGLYQVVAEGSGDVGKFAEILSVPEAVREPKANTTAFDNGDVIMKRTEPLALEWHAPSVLNEANVMLLDVLVATQTEIYQLSCGVLEKSLVKAGESVATWTVPADMMAKLPASPKAEIRLTRGHEMQARSGFAGRLQGLRKAVASAVVN